jgi:molybdate transport system substrate-binding protein
MRLVRPLTVVAAALVLGAAGAPQGQGRAVLTVFAAASLTDAFEEIGSRYRTLHPGTGLRFNFAGSHQLAAQLELGARADVFASADRRWMDRVAGLGLAAGPPAVFAHNRLVIIAPSADASGVRRPEDLARPGLKLVLPAEAVPAGRYARQVVRALALSPGMSPGFERRVLANLVSEEENVRGVVAKVVLGEADAGLVYRSDVTPGVATRLRLVAIPDSVNAPASYFIVALNQSAHPAEARAFVELVRGPEGRAILARHGFLPAADAP